MSLLTTKLHAPPTRPGLVPRPALIDRLQESLRRKRKLTLFSAPAGFGKTTLITEWVNATGYKLAWVSLDEGDSDPVQFLQYLIAALQSIDSEIGQALLQVLSTPRLPSVKNLIAPLINEINTTGQDIILVLDDYHAITSPKVHEIVEFLLEYQPACLHLVIGTRADPPLPLPQMRVSAKITEMREHDLRFTREEAATFLTETMHLNLSEKAVAALEARTEGWVAGMQLAALALQNHPGNAEDFVATFTGDDRFIMDYLVSEVVDRQPKEIREFLRRTAILHRLTAPLCNALTGRRDSQKILERLDQANLFVVALDNRREWFRYYSLFGDVLRATLDDKERQRLHQQAIKWYEQNGYADRAIQHALALAEVSGDYRQAERLIQDVGETTLYTGNISTMQTWLDALPEQRLRANNALAAQRAWAAAFSGDLELAEEYAALTEANLGKKKSDRELLGKLHALRSFLAIIRENYESAVDYASRALDNLPHSQAHARIIALWTLAEASERTSEASFAIEAFREAHRAGQQIEHNIFAAVVEMSLASALNEHGERRAAIEVCQQALNNYEDEHGRTSPLAGMVLSRLGHLYYEANELQASLSYHEQALALTKQVAQDDYVMLTHVLAAPTFFALGETERAFAALQQGYEHAAPGGISNSAWATSEEVKLRLRLGDRAFAKRWVDKAAITPADPINYIDLDQKIVLARYLVSEGEPDEVRAYLKRLEKFTREREQYRKLLTVHILQTLLAHKCADKKAAHDHLKTALKLAAPEEYYRAFLDEDTVLLDLLPDVRATAPLFVDRLLAFATGSEAPPTTPGQQLVDPLSDRE
ncbi:MAG: tetratricopeptide repeat protein, partial [Anaerolineales bacterium]|nr:tetratricopeptide repeat protein [Anaerolineales bacterium]